MTQAPVKRLILKMSVPTIISMLVTSIYNMVDSFFVGHLSTEAVAGVGVAFAYMTFINACGFFFGHGSGNYISRALGARRTENAGKMAATGFLSPLLLGAFAGALGLVFMSPLSRALGATEQILPSTNAYLRYILIATPFMMSSLTLNNQLRLQGNARFGMIGIASGAILNILLDPLFIFALNMGVSGASLATAISQLFGWSLLLWGTSREGNVHIRIRNFTPTWEYYKQIISGGLPSLARQALAVVATICLNRMAVHYADPGNEASVVAAFSIVTRVIMMSYALIIGLGQGFQPVCGYNYGAKLYGRVKESYLFCLTLSTAVLIVLATLGYLFAPDIIALFRSEDPELIRVGTHAMRWQCIAFPLMGLCTATNMLLQNINYTWQATFLSMCRQGICFLPAVFIAPWLWGLTGLEAAQAIADALTFLISLPFAIWIIQKLSTESSNAEKL
ncbi:MAG: MATE family efflux transporter [Bacteroidales bacterium]|nr:MATE family efflux transporter [Bacteroidales bacterium]